MKNFTLYAALLAGAFSPISVGAHWVYNRLIVNGSYVGEPWQYIRQPSNGNNFLSDVNSTDMRCNTGASSGIALGTETATVRAGDELGFGIGETFGHPGIQQVYLSRAPDLNSSSSSSSSSSPLHLTRKTKGDGRRAGKVGGAAATYDGSGGWARIYSLTTTPTLPDGTGTASGKNSFAEAAPDAVDWATHKLHSFIFKLPDETPAGEYLLRAEGMAVHAAHKPGGAQFYVACAQIRVVTDDDGSGSSNQGDRVGKAEMGQLVKIPGVYTGSESGVLIPEFWSKLSRYAAPGPGLWPAGTQEQHVARYCSDCLA